MRRFTKAEIKDALEMAEAVITIVMAIVALWGGVRVWESGVLRKAERVIEAAHEDIQTEVDASVLDRL